MTLAQARTSIGRRVVYLARRRLGQGTRADDVGEIVAVNETFVFVRYGSQQHSAATRPEDIDLEAP